MKMNNQDIFHQLQSGTRSTRKRKHSSTSAPAEPKSLDDTPSALPSALDFFGTNKKKNGSVEPPSKRQRLSAAPPASDSDEAGSDSDPDEGSTPAALSAPNKSRKAPLTGKSIKKWRVKHKIRCQPEADAPAPLTSFDELQSRYEAKEYLVQNITSELGFTTPTPIQMQAIPALIERHEVLACAPTGSGKTAAFSIPMLAQLKNPSKGNHRALVISPTRELAMQIYQQIKRLCKGKGFRVCLLTKATTPLETASTTRRFDIVVSTPLRLVRLIQEGSITLETIEYLVMDEADQLFELGFLAQMDEIIAACSNPHVLRCLFSATMPPEVEKMANSFLRNPLRIVIGSKNSAAATLKQRLIFCGQEEGKILALRQLIAEGIQPPVIIFVQSKERAMELFHELVYDNINADVITSDRTKAQRDKTVKQFRTGAIWVLIATDLMARGMDFRSINLVINYDIPPSATQYIHRIGRAGRAGRSGEAISFYTSEDLQKLRSIVNVMRASGMPTPDWMSMLPKPSKKDGRHTPKRASIAAPSPSKPKTNRKNKSRSNKGQSADE